MFDTSRLLSYLSKPIELPNSLWPDIDLAPNEPQPQPLDNSTNLEDSRVLQASGPTTPTPNCTKLQLFSTMTEEIDTSFELLTCNYLVSSPTSSLCSKDVQPNTFSPSPSSRASNSDRIKLKSSSSNPHLRTSNQFNGRRPLYPAASSISLISPSSAVQQNGSDSSTFPSFARNKKHSSGASFDETLYTRRLRTNRSIPNQPCDWYTKDGSEEYEFDLISDDSPISTPAISPSTSPQPQSRPYDNREDSARKENVLKDAFLHDVKASDGRKNFQSKDSSQRTTGAVKVVHSTSSSDSDWYNELVDGLDFGANDEWISTCMTKSNYHQNVRFSSFDEEKSLPPPPLPLSRTRPKDIRPIVSKTTAINTRNTTQFASPPTLKHSQNTDNKSSKSEPRLRRVVDSIKSPASLKTATQSRRSSTSPPQARDVYQPARESLRYDSKNTHSTRLQNHFSTTKNSSTPPSSAVGPRTCTVETKPNSSYPHPFLRKNSATISNKSRTPSQPFSPSPKPDVVKRRYPDVINNKSTGSVNNTPRKNSGPKPTLASTPQHLKVITRSGANHPIDLKVKTSLEGTSERSNKSIVNNEGVTKSRLSGLLSPTRPGLIPYPFREKKKTHIVGNMQFDPVKMCWNSVGSDGNSEEVNGEDDPFANFSSDEEDSVFSLNAQGTSEDPVEEFIVGTEFQLSPHELRGMFKAEIEHKSTMQRWYTKADRCTNHDRIGLKNPRGVELFDIRPTWRDRFGPR